MVAGGGFSLIAVLSGRAVRDVAAKVGIDSIVYGGNHGAEYLVSGIHRTAPNAVAQADAIGAVVACLRRTIDIPGVYYEDKGFTASVHYRNAPDPSDAERRLQSALAKVPSIDSFNIFRGRMLLEIRPTHAVDKGDALATLAAEYQLDALMFVGDDATDIDGMRRLAELSVLTAVGVAVVSADTPPALIAAADYSVTSVVEVVRVLELLAGTACARRSGLTGVPCDLLKEEAAGSAPDVSPLVDV